MLPTPALILLAIPLLAMPGPSNALIAAAGAQRGVRHSLVLLAALPLAYLLAMSGWVFLLGSLVDRAPGLLALCQIGAAFVLLLFGWRIWTEQRAETAPLVASVPRLFVTTLINPKALILAVAILPGWSAGRIALVAALSAPVGLCWLIGGQMLASAAGDRLSMRGFGRLVALVYGGFGLYLAGAGLSFPLAS